MTSKKSQKESSLFLALLLFIGAAGLIFAYLGSEERSGKGKGSPVLKTAEYEKAVNKHLMLTNEQIEMQRKKMQIETAAQMNSNFNATKPQAAFHNDSHLDLQSDDKAAEIAKELGRGSRFEEVNSPNDVIQKELFNQQQMQQYTEAYREEYARQFVENARRGGYKVILSEDLSRVISVTPIRNPSQQSMDLFNDNGKPIQ